MRLCRIGLHRWQKKYRGVLFRSLMPPYRTILAIKMVCKDCGKERIPMINNWETVYDFDMKNGMKNDEFKLLEG